MSANPIKVPNRDYMARLHWRLRERLPMWVVYAPVTREYPGKWVARMHVTLPEPKPTRFVLVDASLADLRRLLPLGLTRFDRDPADVPEIEEVWL
jgi:hypothetical protein